MLAKGMSKESFVKQWDAKPSGGAASVFFLQDTHKGNGLRVQHHDKRNRAYACEKAVAEDQATVKDRSI